MSSHQNKKPKNDSAAPELPGFYFDAEKKRYFKIQNNSFGQTNIPTSESIKNREKRCEVDKSVKVQIKSRERALIDNLFSREVSGLNRESFSDLQLQYAKLNSLGRYKYRLNDRLSESSFYKISTIETAEKTLLLATYKRESEKYAAIFEVCIGLKANEQGLKPMRFLFEHSWEAINTKSSLPIYCDGHNRLVFSINSIESNRQKSTLYICKLELVGNECLLKATSPSDFIKFEYENSHLLCSKISSDGAKLAAGLTNGVVVRTINAESDSGRIRLNVKDSDCFCLDFRADSNHFLFAGCSDRSIYGFDLRKSTKRSDVQFIHRSIVNDLVPHSFNDNYLFSNEYNGEVSLWDMRFTKERLGLYNDKCQSDSNSSIKLDKSCKYLYQIPKDGHVRIYDVKSSRLIRTILSPFAKQDHETYAQIPDICFTNSSDIIYAIKDYVYMFKC